MSEKHEGLHKYDRCEKCKTTPCEVGFQPEHPKLSAMMAASRGDVK